LLQNHVAWIKATEDRGEFRIADFETVSSGP
jgi:hypothetical protein